VPFLHPPDTTARLGPGHSPCPHPHLPGPPAGRSPATRTAGNPVPGVIVQNQLVRRTPRVPPKRRERFDHSASRGRRPLLPVPRIRRDPSRKCRGRFLSWLEKEACGPPAPHDRVSPAAPRRRRPFRGSWIPWTPVTG